MKLTELFQPGQTQAHEWRQIKPTEYVFWGKERKYIVLFQTIDDFDFHDYSPFSADMEIDLNKAYDLMFYAMNDRGTAQYDIIGSGGDQIKIFATVIDIVEHFVRTLHPELIRFSAKEASRKRLYDRFMRLARQRFPTAMTTSTQVDGHTYYWMLFKVGW